MTELRERDAMVCRSCGREERASEGYPCKDCGTFICIMCVFKGVVRCERCAASATSPASPASPASAPVSGVDIGSSDATQIASEMDWPEH